MANEPPRKRARLACTVCNARRVKCDVTERQPCGNCVAAGNTPCETRESRRGKHPRRSRVSETPKGRSREDSTAGLDTKVASPPASTTPRHHDEVAASRVLASLSGFQPSSNEVPTPLASVSTATNPQPVPISHSQLEDHSAVPTLQRNEDDGAVFLGESSSLRYMTDGQAPTIPTPKRPRLRHSVPNAVKADALIPQWEAERRQARMKSLQADGAFAFPLAPVRQGLLTAYFRWFHPNFPIVDEPEIWNAHREGSMSPLLLQAMLFVGVIHCGESTLNDLGWGNRHRAKYQFYTRAKDIYDAEYETKKLTVIQSLFLLSFWRAGALLEKDARHWLGTAITLAQTKALHRSPPESDGHITKLKRRLWWAIYIRERQCSSALGLPNRIRDEDCDVEHVSPTDFESAFNFETTTSTVSKYTAYMIGIMQLAICMGKIVDAGLTLNRTLTTQDRQTFRNELFEWKQQLPLCIQLSSDAGEQPSFQASMLHLAYNNLLILLHRSAFIANADADSEAANIALQAASRNSRIVEDMLSDGNICHAQLHVITNLFNTLCIYVAHLRRSSGINRTIAEHRAKLCLLGLQELQRTWEVTNWVLQLFFQYLDRTTAARLAMEADDAGISSAAAQNPSGLDLNSTAPNPVTAQPPNSSTIGGLFGGTAAAITTAPVGDLDDVMMPWSWTTDEANQYLFSQIENDFAFGEGGMLEWSPDEVLGGAMPDLGFGGLDALG
ncbi:hypothetical protein K458DRAFT_407228 [Lentithecium fluviatile CBS 122367]|uniref:Zn(2)-C6 fungal-type domain-containing protein n=1 Tax=Lentithecium fluviatile CBS 122367 TaxID=1168545 RepID=A0A6G1IR61_9PLEO|nr:hypothetical protein K458DRAFT_407228 [Lentithecium fluviatile CBS 122367]